MTWKGWETYGGPQVATTRSKYGAVKVTVDGMAFDSKREAARYQDLIARLHAGDIRGLRRQPRYALCPLIIEHADVRECNAGTATELRVPVAEYVADFEYEESDRGFGSITWTLIVEDVKGKRTDVYSLKRRWFEAQYGLAIKEV